MGSNKYQEYQNLKTNKGTAVKGSPRKETCLWTKRIFIATMKKEKSRTKLGQSHFLSVYVSLTLTLLYFLVINLKRQKLNFWSSEITHERSWMRNVPALKGEMPSMRNWVNKGGGGWVFSSQFNSFLFLHWPIRKSSEPHLPLYD